MAKRRMAIIAMIICLCLQLMPFCAFAATTADAKEPINSNKDCSLIISYRYNDLVFKDLLVMLYKVADVSADFQYTLTGEFLEQDIILNGIKSNSEWNVVGSTLEANIIANNITADYVLNTDANGNISLKSLTPGLYFALTNTVKQGEVTCCFNSTLIALPSLTTTGSWQYDVAVTPKYEIIPNKDNEKVISYNVIKLWKGDEGKNIRPKNIEVEIFKDGKTHKNVILSNENNWSYNWTVKNDGSKWMVSEKSEFDQYTKSVAINDTTFVLTNTYKSTTTNSPSDPPQTGDTSNIMLYVIIMIIAGITMIITGSLGKSKSNEKTN